MTYKYMLQVANGNDMICTENTLEKWELSIDVHIAQLINSKGYYYVTYLGQIIKIIDFE